MAKAQPIIAMERGINARSRVLLEAAAQDMKLPEDLFGQAIHMLQGAPPVSKKKAKDHWVEAFDKYLEQKIKDAPQGIVTAEIEARCIRRGMKKFDLAEDQARDTVREVADRLGLHRITLSEAERHVADMIEQKVGDAAWLDDKTMTRLRAAGVGWGLTAEQVDALIRQHTAENRDRQEHEQRMNLIMLTGAGVVVLIGICVFVGVVLFGTGDRSTATNGSEPAAGDVDSESPPPQASVPIEEPDWWNDELIGNFTRLRTNAINKTVPLKEIYQQITSPDAGERTNGYAEFFKRCANHWDEIRAQGSFPNVIGLFAAECYRIEPDTEAADSIRENLVSLFALDEEHPPKDELYFERAFWGLGVSLDALKVDELAEDRAQALQADIGRAIRTPVSRTSEIASLLENSRAALARSYYGNLTEVVSKQPHVAADLHQHLSAFVKQHRTTFRPLHESDEVNRLEADFVVSMLDKSPNQFMRYRKDIRDLAQNGEPLIVARFIDLMERTKTEQLQSEIAVWLIGRFDIPVGDVATRKASVSPAAGPNVTVNDLNFDIPKLATLIRAELGIEAPVAVATAADRWQDLQARIDEPLARLKFPAVNDEDYLKRIVDVSHYATLACAVAQQEPGFAIFDKLLEEGPPGTKKADGTDPVVSTVDTSSSEPTPRQLDDVEQYVEPLERYETKLDTQKSFERLSYIRGLRNLAEDVPDISPQQAETIARYLVGPKEFDEHTKLMEYIQPMSKWNRMVLALADAILTRVNDRAPAEALLSAFLGRELELDDARWQLSVYEQLLHIVHDRIADRTVTSDKSDPHQGYLEAASALHELHKIRAEVLGIAPGALSATQSSSEVLRLLVDRDGARMSGGSTKSPDGKFLAQLPHQLRTVEYLATNDLRRTVLLQRIRSRLLSIEIKRRQPNRAKEASQLIDDLASSDANAPDVIQQLAQGEATALKMWLLFAPK